jgi:hypothetical protein
MAPRTSTPDLSSLLKPSAGLKTVSHGKTAGPNPLAGFVAQSVGNALCLPIPLPLPDGTKADAKTVTNLLRRDVGDQEIQLSVQYQDGKGNVLAVKRSKDPVTGKTVSEYPDGVREIHFVAKAGKKERAYTADDIRAWHYAQTGQKVTGKVPPAVRDAYKAAHGHATAKVETTA